MPEPVEKTGHGVTPTSPSTNEEASKSPTPAINESQTHPPESMISPRASESDNSYPFDSQSSLDEENGDAYELAEIQHELERLDRWEYSDGVPTRLISRRKDSASDDSRRKELIDRLHSKLAQYDESLLQWQKIQAIKRPTERAQRNMYDLISNTQSLVKDESHWIREGPDLAALGQGNEHGWLNTFQEDLLNKISRKVTMAIFSTSEQQLRTGDEDLYLLSANRFDILIRVVLTIIAAILLLVPVFVLFRLQPTSQADFRRKSNYQILTVFLFTLAFSASCALFTRARRQEVFTATAAYSAVLVVFLGNISNVVISQQSG